MTSIPPRALATSASDRAPDGAPDKRVVDALVDQLVEAGVTHAFGLSGGAIALFVDALRGKIEVVHCRHEGGAAFAATELSLATDRPAVVFTTTGPGLTNALTGLYAGYAEGAHLVLVSGATAEERRGMSAFQETGRKGWPWLASSSAPHERLYEVRVEVPAHVHTVGQRLGHLTGAPEGGVLRVMLSTAAQGRAAPARQGSGTYPSVGTRHTYARGASMCADLLEGDVALWVGFGARHASDAVRRLAEHRGWRVMSTPRGKGIFPETHPLYLGVTGLGGDGAVLEELARERPDHVVVLGSRLGEMSSFWHPGYLPTRALVHVDVDRSVFGRAYPDVRTIGVPADAGEFVEGLLAALPPADAPRPPPSALSSSALSPIIAPPSSPRGVHPATLMAAVQREVVEASDAIVMTEAGNAFAWGSCALRFDRPRYRVSTGFGAMGQATAGVVGAALARPGRKAVALVGDGAMLMHHEVSTAVKYGAQAVWIVLNDAKYGMVEHGMRAIGMEPIETEIPRADFAMIARAVGAVGLSVSAPDDLDAALERAMREARPVVVDVRVDPDVPPPFGARNASLRRQGMEVDP
jgi:acetolactate synthase-1/2/3 large subunit